MSVEIDLGRVICSLRELEAKGAVGFAIGEGDWPVRGFVVQAGGAVLGFRNVCPHAGHPLNLLPNRFLSPDGTLIVCASHGALFEKSTGLCVAGPCRGERLEPLPVTVQAGYVMLP